MKKFLMLILFPLIVSASDLQLLHEALVEGAQSDNQKRVVAASKPKKEKVTVTKEATKKPAAKKPVAKKSEGTKKKEN